MVSTQHDGQARAEDASSSRLLVLGAPVVDALLDDISIADLVANQSDVFHAYSLSSGDKGGAQPAWESPMRTAVTTSLHTHLFMPSRHDEQTTIKCVAVPRPHADAPPGLPAAGLTFNRQSGKLDVLLNAAQLTAVRTAAGCLAASIAMQPKLAPTTTLVVFGTGNQARWHARLFVGHYDLKHVYFISTNAAAKGVELTHIMEEQLHVDTVRVYAQGSDEMYAALREADFVCGCTPSRSPLFAWERCSEWKQNLHFSLIGSYRPDMQEVPVEVIQRAAQHDALAVDSVEACRHEAGDLLQAHVDSSHWREIGHVVKKGGCYDASDRMSVFKSVGFALQDTAIFTLIAEQARKRGVGEWIEFH